MRHEWDEPAKVEIADVNLTFDTYLNKPYIDDDLRSQLQKANILIVPVEGFRDSEEPMFPDGTGELYQFLVENVPDGVAVDVAINDDNFTELALHSDLIIIGSFLVHEIITPTFVHLLSDYIKYRWSSRASSESPASDRAVSVTLVVASANGDSKSITYNGPTEEFSEHIVPVINRLALRGNDVES